MDQLRRLLSVGLWMTAADVPRREQYESIDAIMRDVRIVQEFLMNNMTEDLLFSLLTRLLTREHFVRLSWEAEDVREELFRRAGNPYRIFANETRLTRVAYRALRMEQWQQSRGGQAAEARQIGVEPLIAGDEAPEGFFIAISDSSEEEWDC